MSNKLEKAEQLFMEAKKLLEEVKDEIEEDDKYFNLRHLYNDNFELNFTHDRCIKAGLYNDGFMLIRGSAELQNKAFYLSSFYDWEIVIDSEKIKCLVPTKKKV